MRSDGTQSNEHDGLYLFQSVTSGDLDTEVQHLDQNQLSQPSFLNFSSVRHVIDPECSSDTPDV